MWCGAVLELWEPAAILQEGVRAAEPRASPAGRSGIGVLLLDCWSRLV